MAYYHTTQTIFVVCTVALEWPDYIYSTLLNIQYLVESYDMSLKNTTIAVFVMAQSTVSHYFF